MVRPAQQRCAEIGGFENKLLYVGAGSIAAGANSPWPMDADSRAVTIIAVIIAIIVRLARPAPSRLARAVG